MRLTKLTAWSTSLSESLAWDTALKCCSTGCVHVGNASDQAWAQYASVPSWVVNQWVVLPGGGTPVVEVGSSPLLLAGACPMPVWLMTESTSAWSHAHGPGLSVSIQGFMCLVALIYLVSRWPYVVAIARFASAMLSRWASASNLCSQLV